MRADRPSPGDLLLVAEAAVDSRSRRRRTRRRNTRRGSLWHDRLVGDLESHGRREPRPARHRRHQCEPHAADESPHAGVGRRAPESFKIPRRMLPRISSSSSSIAYGRTRSSGAIGVEVPIGGACFNCADGNIGYGWRMRQFVGSPRLPLRFHLSIGAVAGSLNGRTRPVSVRAIHATITRLRLQNLATGSALVKILATICGHPLCRGSSTDGTGDRHGQLDHGKERITGHGSLTASARRPLFFPHPRQRGGVASPTEALAVSSGAR